MRKKSYLILLVIVLLLLIGWGLKIRSDNNNDNLATVYSYPGRGNLLQKTNPSTVVTGGNSSSNSSTTGSVTDSHLPIVDDSSVDPCKDIEYLQGQKDVLEAEIYMDKDLLAYLKGKLEMIKANRDKEPKNLKPTISAAHTKSYNTLVRAIQTKISDLERQIEEKNKKVEDIDRTISVYKACERLRKNP